MPIDACATQMLFRALGQFWDEFLYPVTDGESIDSDPTLS